MPPAPARFVCPACKVTVDVGPDRRAALRAAGCAVCGTPVDDVAFDRLHDDSVDRC